MNHVNLIGRLTADSELRYTQSGTAVATFTLAVQRKMKNKNTNQYESDFIRCIAWQKTAELIANHFKKGDGIGITGHIQTGSYDGNDGTKRFTTDVVVDSLYFLPAKAKGAANSGSDATDYGFGEEVVFDSSDLPF